MPEFSTPGDRDLAHLRSLLPRVKIYTVEPSTPSPKAKISSIQAIRSKLGRLKRRLPFERLSRLLRKSLRPIPQPVGSHQDTGESEFAAICSLHSPYHFHSPNFIKTLHKIIREQKIDLVQIEFNENLTLVKAIPASIKRVFIDHECRFSRLKSHTSAKQIHSDFTDYVYHLSQHFDLSLIRECDAVITFRESDTQVLAQSLKQSPHSTQKPVQIFTIPFPVLDQDFQAIDQTLNRPTRLTFIGPERHFPNQDAVEWFVEEIAIAIWKRFGLQLYVIGEWSSSTIQRYHGHASNVQFTGFVQDVYPFTKDSISIAPIRIGAGLKTKVMLAMAQGVPVIGTHFALEGINAKHLESVLIANDVESFCWAVEYLLEDLDRTRKICQQAQNLMRQQYSQTIVANQRHAAYQALMHESRWISHEPLINKR